MLSHDQARPMKTSFKFSLGLPLLAVLFLLAGCVVTSVYPYFTAKDVIFDEALVGTWADAETANAGENNWQFARTNGQGYTLLIRDGDETNEFKAHLFKLKDRRFIDAEPVKRVDDFIPPHYLLQVHRLDAKGLEMTFMSRKWLEELLKQEPEAIPHLWVDRDEAGQKSGDLVLTADTPKLQAFVLKYAADTNAFAGTFTMARQ